MSKPIVAIVGRPNVGKSTLFNVLAGDNISIVKDTPGVTRDRIYADVEWLNHKFTLVDTGGIEPESKDIILSQMRDQAQIAIDTANVIIFITDVRQGLVDADAKVADMLRRSRKPVVLVVNKVDNFDRQMMDVYEFYNLGIGEPHAISASGKLGIGDMLDEVTGYFDPEMENEEESEIPRIAIVGKPNVGKSSLLNAIVGERIASVSNKPQTTRTRITGIKTVGEIQMVFMDTPGLHKPKNKLSTYMLQAAKEAVNDMDVVLFVADCTRQPTEQELEFLQPLKASKTKVMLVLNKIDLLEEKNVLMQRIAEWNAAFPFAESFPISVSENDGVDLVEEAVCHCAIPAPHYFPDDKITDQPEQVLIAEMIREQVLRLLRDEVPHGVAVAVERLSERDDKDLLDIDATIYCERESHKGILIGKKGAMLKRIASQARAQLEQFFQIQVNLQCWVKVKEDWRNRDGLIRNFGLNNLDK